MLIYVVETQIQMRFYKLLLGSKNTTCSVTRKNGGYQGKIHFSTTTGMRLNHHGNFKVQRFQLFEQIEKDDCVHSPTVPHLPLRKKNLDFVVFYRTPANF